MRLSLQRHQPLLCCIEIIRYFEIRNYVISLYYDYDISIKRARLGLEKARLGLEKTTNTFTYCIYANLATSNSLSSNFFLLGSKCRIWNFVINYFKLTSKAINVIIFPAIVICNSRWLSFPQNSKSYEHLRCRLFSIHSFFTFIHKSFFTERKHLRVHRNVVFVRGRR